MHYNAKWLRNKTSSKHQCVYILSCAILDAYMSLPVAVGFLGEEGHSRVSKTLSLPASWCFLSSSTNCCTRHFIPSLSTSTSPGVLVKAAGMSGTSQWCQISFNAGPDSKWILEEVDEVSLEAPWQPRLGALYQVCCLGLAKHLLGEEVE